MLEAEKSLNNSPYSNAFLSYTYGLYYANLKSFNIANKKFTEALSYLEKSKTDVADDRTNILFKEVYRELSVSLANLGKVDEAYQALLKHDSFREKLTDKEKNEEWFKSNIDFAENIFGGSRPDAPPPIFSSMRATPARRPARPPSLRRAHR